MKRPRIVAVLALCVGVLLSGCGARDAAEPGGAASGSAGSGASSQGVARSSGWPDWMPAIIPRYEFGDVLQAIGDDDADGGALIFKDIQMDKDPYASYKQALEKSGWVLVEEQETDEGMFLTMDQGDYWLVYTFPNDGVGVSLYYGGHETDSEGGLSDEKITIDTPLGKLSNEQLPDGYPQELCPIYEPAVLLMSTSTSGDDATLYMVNLGTDHTVADVIAFYEKADNYQATEPGMMGGLGVTLGSGNDETWAQVTVTETPAEGEQDYSTLIMILVNVEAGQ